MRNRSFRVSLPVRNLQLWSALNSNRHWKNSDVSVRFDRFIFDFTQMEMEALCRTRTIFWILAKRVLGSSDSVLVWFLVARSAPVAAFD